MFLCSIIVFKGTNMNWFVLLGVYNHTQDPCMQTKVCQRYAIPNELLFTDYRGSNTVGKLIIYHMFRATIVLQYRQMQALLTDFGRKEMFKYKYLQMIGLFQQYYTSRQI